jgi:hypothetical protein
MPPGFDGRMTFFSFDMQKRQAEPDKENRP